MAAAKKPLSGAALRHLRGLGHALDPVIALGKAGITEALVAETKRALSKHELVKVRVQGEAPVDRKEAAAALATETDAEMVQVLGRTFLLFKRNPEKSKIVLPKPLTKHEKAKADKAAKAAAKKSGQAAVKPGANAAKAVTAPAVEGDDDGDIDGDIEEDDDEELDEAEGFDSDEEDVDGGVEGDDDDDDDDDDKA